MAKDYAKATFEGTRTRRKQRSRGGLLPIIFVSLLLIGLLAGYYLYQNKAVVFNHKNIALWVDQMKSLLHREKPQLAANPSAKNDQSNAPPSEPEVHFDFYTELPNMQVKLPATENEVGKNTPSSVAPLNNPAKPAVAAKTSSSANEEKILSIPMEMASEAALSNAAANPAKRAPEAAAEPQYVVQVGAYKNDSTASEMRISILLAGFDVSVVKTKVGDQIVYRIQEGPYSSMARAKSAQKKLQAKGFDGVVQRIN
jgi:cell division protein FtsN